MRLGYSEFSFGYALTENLIRSSSKAPSGAPVFPNLVQEAQLGFDVNINLPGLPLFFQFKLPELMKRMSAKENSVYNIGLPVPFFRMPIMRRDLSGQHDRLIELEARFPGSVLYASPRLESLTLFNIAYNAGRVHERSVFFSPTEIGTLPDDKEHTVAYQGTSSAAFFCSEPRQIAAISYETLAGTVQHEFELDRYRTLREAARELRETARTLVSVQMRTAE